VSSIPSGPKAYHITHLSNLPGIIAEGVLWSDAKRIELGLQCEIVGMSEIKRRRLEELAVGCYPHTRVGEYVPFYFCPRSVMLFLLHMANHPDLTYRGGQIPIVHLVADLDKVVEWAERTGRLWTFSDRNAGTRYTAFFNRVEDLDKVNWDAVRATNFRPDDIQEGKQAEFLLYESFPWHLVEKIGVINRDRATAVRAMLVGTTNPPLVSVERAWYF
jgi:hypothetical protein